MKFLPRDSFYIITALSANDALDKLRKEVASPYDQIRQHDSFNTKKYFSGIVGFDEFEIRENVARKSQVPLIKGKVWEIGGDTHIAVTMSLQVPTIVFMCIWFLFLGLMAILFFIQSPKDKLWNTFPVPLAFISAGYLMMIGSFIPDSISHKNRLAKIFEGKTEPSKKYAQPFSQQINTIKNL